MKVLVVLVLVLSGVSCRKTDVRTCKIWVPGLKNDKCAELIISALMQYTHQANMDNSVPPDKIKVDLEEHTMELQYESLKLSLKNIEHTIAGAGFAANDIPANSNAMARLPPECR